jgi:exonuclease SbcD
MLLLNDIHISKDNIPDFQLNWNEALIVCDQHEIKEIAIGGDLFMSRSAQTLDVLLAVHDAFIDAEKRGINITLANGNHDKVNQESERGYCHVFDQHPNVYVANDYLSVENEDWSFVLFIMPYFIENGSFTDRLRALWQGEELEYEDKKTILYIHEGINGALAQSSDKELPAKIFESFDKVLVGHYHNRTKIKGTNIEYIGSSRQHNFGEDEEKGYTIIYSDGSHKFVKNQVNIRYKVIDVPFEKVNTNLYDLLDENKGDGRYKTKVRIHCLTTQAPSIDKQKLIDSGANKVEIITEDIEEVNVSKSSLFEKYDNKQIKKTYEDFCEEKEIADISLGLSYLSKID